MKTLLDTKSLAGTIDNVSEVLLLGNKINETVKKAVADFIVSRHGKPNSYANMFAPTDADMKRDLILFTGEKITTGAGKCHVLGEESSRILRKLDLRSESISLALREADEGILSRINESMKSERYIYGTFCCKSCSVSMWLNLSAGGLNNDTKMLKAGLDWLKLHRDGRGRWKSFPYFYTLYVLNEIDYRTAKEELDYAGAYLKYGKFRSMSEKYDHRREIIVKQILEKL